MGGLRASMRAVLLLLGGGVALSAQADAPPPTAAAGRLGVQPGTPFELTEAQESRAKAVGQEVVCLCGTCPRHTITDCQCGWAQQNKEIIRLAVSKGLEDQAIIDGYVSAYGEKVLEIPPSNLPVVVPYLMAAVALAALVGVGARLGKNRRSARSGGPAEASAAAPEGTDDELRQALQQELEEIDR